MHRAGDGGGGAFARAVRRRGRARLHRRRLARSDRGRLAVRLSLAPLSNFDLGAFFALLIALAAYRLDALTFGGALAAFVVGACTFGSGGGAFATVLLAFFMTSTGLSRYGKARKRALLVDIEKSGARDATQVLANGGVATLCALAAFVTGGAPWAAAFAGAYAAATADTWATEVGTLARGAPRSILSGKRIPTGLSGGITPLGTAAGIGGAGFIAVVAMQFGVASGLGVFVAGVAGMLVDSLLGASLQTLRWCANCKRPCETAPHACGADTTVIRGASWFTNDGVNFAATLTGAAAGYVLAAFAP